MPWYLPESCPPLWDELRRRARSGRGFLVMLVYALVLVIILTLIAGIAQDTPDPRQWPEIGRRLWTISLAAQLALMIVICPALTAGTVAMEREGRTLELLFLSPMSTLALELG